MCRVLASLAIALTLSISPFLWGQDTTQETAVAEESQNAREPDVIYVPTPQDVVDKMLDARPPATISIRNVSRSRWRTWPRTRSRSW